MSSSWDFYMETGDSALDSGDYQRALELYERARKELGPREKSGRAIITEKAIFAAASGLGDYARQENALRRLARMFENATGPDLKEKAHWNSQLSDLLRIVDRDAESIEPLKTSIKALEQLEGPESLSAAVFRNNLAMLLKWLGRPDEARLEAEAALAVLEKKADQNDPRLGQMHQNLGEIYQTLDEPREAHEHFRRGLVVREGTDAGGPAEVVESLNSLAGANRDLGNYDDAMVLFERALELADDSLGDDSLAAAVVRDNFAQTLQERGDAARAGELLNEALPVYTIEFGPDDPETADLRKRIEKLSPEKE